MKPGEIRLVLKEPDPRKAVGVLAYDEEWKLLRIADRTERDPYEIIYGLEDGDTRIYYSEDHIIGLAYITIVKSRAAEVAALIRERLHVFSVDDILKEAQQAKTRDDWISVVYELGAAAPPEADARIINVFERALQHDDADVRRAAIVGITYTEWKEFAPLLARVAGNDPDPEVRKYAHVTLDGLNKLT
jgi:hypothetical protein